jgi:hypothetical protein
MYTFTEIEQIYSSCSSKKSCSSTEAFSEVMLERIFPVRKIFLLGMEKSKKEN